MFWKLVKCLSKHDVELNQYELNLFTTLFTLIYTPLDNKLFNI